MYTKLAGVLFCVLATLATFSLSAQTPFDEIPGDGYQFPARYDPLESPYLESELGLILDHFSTDAVSLRADGTVVVNKAPTLHNWTKELPEPATAFAIWSEEGEQQHTILASVASGMKAFIYNRSTGEFVSRYLGRTIAWWNARDIAVLEGDGVTTEDDIVGIHWSGFYVVGVKNPEDPFPIDTNFFVVNEASELELFEWGGQRLIALVTTFGLEIFELDGTFVAQYPGTTLALTKYNVPSVDSNDRLAWIVREGNKDVLYTVSSSGGLDNGLLLGDQGTVSVDAADIWGLGEQDDDLIISRTSGWDLLVLPSFLGSYVANNWRIVPVSSGSAAANQANPAVGDLDNDGDPDVFFPLEQDDQEIFVFLNGEVDQNEMGFEPDTANLGISIWTDETFPGSDEYVTTLIMRFDNASALPPEATDCQVLIWSKASADLLDYTVPARRINIPVAPSNPDPFASDYTISTVLHQGEPDFDDIFFIAYRAVERTNPGTVDWSLNQVWASRFFVYTSGLLSDEGDSVDWIDNNWPYVPPNFVTTYFNDGLPGGTGDTSTGGGRPGRPGSGYDDDDDPGGGDEDSFGS